MSAGSNVRAGSAVRAAVVACLVASATPALLASPAAAADAQQCDPTRTQYVTVRPPALGLLSADAAWQLADGSGVVVAVVDSGVDARNAHLGGAVSAGVDLVGDGDGRTDVDGHGTAVAGVIAARPVEGSGVVGLAPGATILPVRVFTSQDAQAERAGTAPTAKRIAAGIDAAVEHGARVVNVSLSTASDDPALRAAVARATRSGALVVASTGNRTDDSDEPADAPRYPAASPGALAVVAVGADGAPTEGAFSGPHVDVAAPGTSVPTAYFAAGDCVLADGAASSSLAAAYVSAAAALLVQRFPDESPAQWAYRLEASAARTSPGVRTDVLGWGVVRPDQALALVDDGTAVGPTSPAHPRPQAAPAAKAHVTASAGVDPLAAVRGAAGWCVLGVLVVVALAALVLRLVSNRGQAATS